MGSIANAVQWLFPYCAAVWLNRKLVEKEGKWEKLLQNGTDFPDELLSFKECSLDDLQGELDRSIEDRKIIQSKAQSHFGVVAIVMTFGVGIAANVGKITMQNMAWWISPYIEISIRFLAVLAIWCFLQGGLCSYRAARSGKYWIELADEKISAGRSTADEIRKCKLGWYLALNRNSNTMLNNLNEAAFRCVVCGLVLTAVVFACLVLWKP